MIDPFGHLQEVSYSIRRYYVDQFYIDQIANIGAGSLILDLGGNKILKRGYFNIENYPLKVIYANLVRTKKPDIQCDAAYIPLASNQFDAVVCAELLEHIFDPRVTIREIFRVLKPGGCLLVTVPFLFRIHGDPDDFGRYTDHFWRRQLELAGFSQNVDIVKQGGFYTVVADFIKNYTDQHRSEKGFAHWLLNKSWRRFQDWAIDKESHMEREKFPDYIFSYTTGFGIKAKK